MKPRQPRYKQIFKDSPQMAEKAKQVWRDVIDELSAKEALTARRVEIADRYARACAEYEAIYPVAASEGPVKIGPNGGDVFNFNWSACEKLNDRMAKFEDQLKLDLRHAEVEKKKPTAPKTKADDYI